MSAGTLSLTNGSTSVSGTNTVFQTDLAANDFIVCRIGGSTYTLGIKTVGSDTALTLTQPFTGPTTSGVAWYAVPNQSLVGITTELAANLTTVYRSVLINDANWMQFYSSSTTPITIQLKDGTTVTGPSWQSMSNTINGKMDKSQNLNDVADKATARTNLGWVSGFLPISLGGTGAGTKANAWAALATYGNTAGTAAQGNDSRLNTVDGKTGGTVSTPVTAQDIVASQRLLDVGNNTFLGGAIQSRLTGNSVRYFEQYLQNGSPLEYYMIMRGDNTNVFTWRFQFGGNAIATNGQWINGGSDIRIKKDFKEIDDPRVKLRAIRAGTWKYDYKGANGKFGIGIIANDIATMYPDAVYHTGDRILENGTTVGDALSVEAGDSGVAVALHHANLLLLSDESEKLQEDNQKLWLTIAELQNRLKALDGLDA